MIPGRTSDHHLRGDYEVLVIRLQVQTSVNKRYERRGHFGGGMIEHLGKLSIHRRRGTRNTDPDFFRGVVFAPEIFHDHGNISE
jgi:hypothetical protein